MQREFEAVFEHGVLRPLEPLQLLDRKRVQVTVLEAPQGIPATSEELADDVSLEEVRKALASIPGSIADAVTSLREDRC